MIFLKEIKSCTNSNTCDKGAGYIFDTKQTQPISERLVRQVGKMDEDCLPKLAMSYINQREEMRRIGRPRKTWFVGPEQVM